MLHTKCREIGTSKGFIIPSSLLEQAHIGINDILDVEYSEVDQTIKIKKSTPNFRNGWAKSFQLLHSNNGDELLIDDVFEDEFNETI